MPQARVLRIFECRCQREGHVLLEVSGFPLLAFSPDYQTFAEGEDSLVRFTVYADRLRRIHPQDLHEGGPFLDSFESIQPYDAEGDFHPALSAEVRIQGLIRAVTKEGELVVDYQGIPFLIVPERRRFVRPMAAGEWIEAEGRLEVYPEPGYYLTVPTKAA